VNEFNGFTDVGYAVLLLMFFDDVVFIRLAQCKSLIKRSSRLSSVYICLPRVRSRKLSETGTKFRHLCRKSGSLSKNMTAYFASKVAKYTKSSPKLKHSTK